MKNGPKYTFKADKFSLELKFRFFNKGTKFETIP